MRGQPKGVYAAINPFRLHKTGPLPSDAEGLPGRGCQAQQAGGLQLG
jgi:hypothetical protein